MLRSKTEVRAGDPIPHADLGDIELAVAVDFLQFSGLPPRWCDGCANKMSEAGHLQYPF